MISRSSYRTGIGLLGVATIVILYAALRAFMKGQYGDMAVMMAGVCCLLAAGILLWNHHRIHQNKSREDASMQEESRLTRVLEIMNNLNNNYSFKEMLSYIHQEFKGLIPYNYIGVAVIDHEKGRIKAYEGVGDGTTPGLPENLVGKSWPIRDTSLGKVIEKGEVRVINDLEAYTAWEDTKAYNRVILGAGIRASISLPLIQGEEALGVIFFSSTRKNIYTEEHVEFLKLLATGLSVSFSQNSFMSEMIYSSTLALAKLAEARDEDTGEHLIRMQNYSKTIAEYLLRDGLFSEVLDYSYVKNIQRFAPLHDIGKVAIPDSIMLKPGPLTEEEFEEMRRHAIYGADVMRMSEENLNRYNRSLFMIGIEIAEGHHEKWDGSGYPHHKKGEEIPLSARIVALADVFDALTSKRPYKEAYPYERAMEMIAEGRGRHFDPVIVDCLFRHRKAFHAVYKKNNPESHI